MAVTTAAAELYAIDGALKKIVLELGDKSIEYPGGYCVPADLVQSAVNYANDAAKLAPKNKELVKWKTGLNKAWDGLKASLHEYEGKPHLMMDEDAFSYLLNKVLNYLANAVHIEAAAHAATTGTLLGCKIIKMPEEAGAEVGKYCSGVIPIHGYPATVMESPYDEVTIKGKTMPYTYPVTIEHPLGVHKATVHFKEIEPGKYETIIRYNESGEGDWKNRQKGVLARLQKEGLECHTLTKGEKGFGTKHGATGWASICWGATEQDFYPRLAVFFSLLLNGDIALKGEELAGVVTDKVWDLAGKVVAKWGENAYKMPLTEIPHITEGSPHNGLEWNELAAEYKHEQEIFAKEPFYKAMSKLAYCRDKHHELEESYDFESGQNIPKEALDKIYANAEEAIAVMDSMGWSSKEVKGYLEALKNTMQGLKVVGGMTHFTSEQIYAIAKTGGPCDMIGNSLHRALYKQIFKAGGYGGCSITPGVGMDDVNAGSMRYCQGVLQGTPAYFSGVGSTVSHTPPPSTFEIYLRDEHPQGKYDVFLTLPGDALGERLKAFLLNHGWKMHQDGVTVDFDDTTGILQLAIFISSLKGVSPQLSPEGLDLAISKAYESAQSIYKDKGDWAFTTAPAIETEAGWTKTLAPFGIKPPGLTKEQQKIYDIIGPDKVWGGCSFAQCETVPNKGQLAYCEGVRQNPLGNINAFANPEGNLVHFFHATTDSIATINITPLKGEYQVNFSNVDLKNDIVRQLVIDKLKSIGFPLKFTSSTSWSGTLDETNLRFIATFLSSLHHVYHLPESLMPAAVDHAYSKAHTLYGNPQAFKSVVSPFTKEEWLAVLPPAGAKPPVKPEAVVAPTGAMAVALPPVPSQAVSKVYDGCSCFYDTSPTKAVQKYCAGVAKEMFWEPTGEILPIKLFGLAEGTTAFLTKKGNGHLVGPFQIGFKSKYSDVYITLPPFLFSIPPLIAKLQKVGCPVVVKDGVKTIQCPSWQATGVASFLSHLRGIENVPPDCYEKAVNYAWAAPWAAPIMVHTPEQWKHCVCDIPGFKEADVSSLPPESLKMLNMTIDALAKSMAQSPLTPGEIDKIINYVMAMFNVSAKSIKKYVPDYIKAKEKGAGLSPELKEVIKTFAVLTLSAGETPETVKNTIVQQWGVPEAAIEDIVSEAIVVVAGKEEKPPQTLAQLSVKTFDEVVDFIKTTLGGGMPEEEIPYKEIKSAIKAKWGVVDDTGVENLIKSEVEELVAGVEKPPKTYADLPMEKFEGLKASIGNLLKEGWAKAEIIEKVKEWYGIPDPAGLDSLIKAIAEGVEVTMKPEKPKPVPWMQLPLAKRASFLKDVEHMVKLTGSEKYPSLAAITHPLIQKYNVTPKGLVEIICKLAAKAGTIGNFTGAIVDYTYLPGYIAKVFSALGVKQDEVLPPGLDIYELAGLLGKGSAEVDKAFEDAWKSTVLLPEELPPAAPMAKIELLPWTELPPDKKQSLIAGIEASVSKQWSIDTIKVTAIDEFKISKVGLTELIYETILRMGKLPFYFETTIDYDELPPFITSVLKKLGVEQGDEYEPGTYLDDFVLEYYGKTTADVEDAFDKAWEEAGLPGKHLPPVEEVPTGLPATKAELESAAIMALAGAGYKNFITAIKMVRTKWPKLGLVEAKDAVEKAHEALGLFHGYDVLAEFIKLLGVSEKASKEIMPAGDKAIVMFANCGLGDVYNAWRHAIDVVADNHGIKGTEYGYQKMTISSAEILGLPLEFSSLPLPVQEMVTHVIKSELKAGTTPEKIIETVVQSFRIGEADVKVLLATLKKPAAKPYTELAPDDFTQLKDTISALIQENKDVEVIKETVMPIWNITDEGLDVLISGIASALPAEGKALKTYNDLPLEVQAEIATAISDALEAGKIPQEIKASIMKNWNISAEGLDEEIADIITFIGPAPAEEIPEKKSINELTPLEWENLVEYVKSLSQTGYTPAEIKQQILTVWSGPALKEDGLHKFILEYGEHWGLEAEKVQLEKEGLVTYDSLSKEQKAKVQKYLKDVLISTGNDMLAAVQITAKVYKVIPLTIQELAENLSEQILAGKYAGCYVEHAMNKADVPDSLLTYCEGVLCHKHKAKTGYLYFDKEHPEKKRVMHYSDGIRSTIAQDVNFFRVNLEQVGKAGKEWAKVFDKTRFTLEDMGYSCTPGLSDSICALHIGEGMLGSADKAKVKTTAIFLSLLNEIDTLEAACIDPAIRYAFNRATELQVLPYESLVKSQATSLDKKEWEEEVCSVVALKPIREKAKEKAKTIPAAELIKLAMEHGISPAGSEEDVCKKLIEAGIIDC